MKARNLSLASLPQPSTNRPQPARSLARFVAGADVFSRQSDGTTIAAQYARHGIILRAANTDRVNGWAEILHRLGDPDAGNGGDDCADALRYLVATKPRTIVVRKLRGA